MNESCRSFRRELERTLEGTREAEGLTSLSWHEHLLSCADCRALLEAEEALETLLDSLPTPQLPPRLARRVLRRLRQGAEQREDALDRLLDLGDAARPPQDLARRVLAGLEHERAPSARSADVRLDALLERAGVVDTPAGLARRVLQGLEGERARPANTADARLDALLERAGGVTTPPRLAERVLAGVAEERVLARRRARPFLVRQRGLLLAAAALLALLALWALWPQRTGERQRSDLAQNGEVDARLLENYDVLEQWELLHRGDLDLLLSTLPQTDQLLLEIGSEESLIAPDKSEKEPGKPSKG